jgi:ethanolamine utilization protein EutJ
VDFSAVNRRIGTLEACIGQSGPVSVTGELFAGVDLGTASLVLVVVNAAGEPVACAMEFARVVRDGLVVDYIGATAIVRRLVRQLEDRLCARLSRAAIAVPPGTGERDCGTHRHVVESAGLHVATVLDEPTAANAVLGIDNGVIVDIGGGTTGLSVLENGRVVYAADEPTGGTHMTLVLAGNYGISIEEAEKLKKDASRQSEFFPLVRPVLEKMASIINRHIEGRVINAIYLVGGACCLKNMETVIAKETGKAVFKPANPFLVTPFGIALHCGAKAVE